jgi:hypothetical protein
MLDPSLWSYQTPVPFDILTANGCPEVFTYTNPTENQATVDYICEWTNRYTVVAHLLGTGVYGVGPVQHPTRTDLFAKRCVISGMHGAGFDGEHATFQYAKLNTTFLTNPQGSVGGGGDVNAFITVETESTGDHMTLPDRQLIWDAAGQPYDGKPLTEPVQIFVPKKAHKVSVRQWFSPNFTNMDNAVGEVNEAAVSWVGRSIPAKCLLFENYSETFDTPISGFSTYKVDMHFLERPRSWNKFLAKDGTWRDVSPGPYSTADFSGIFP